MPTSAASAVYRPSELAERFDVHVTTIYRLIASGELPAYRVGRCLRVPDEAVGRLERTTAAGSQPATAEGFGG